MPLGKEGAFLSSPNIGRHKHKAKIIVRVGFIGTTIPSALRRARPGKVDKEESIWACQIRDYVGLVIYPARA